MAKKVQKKKPVSKPAAPPMPKDFLDMIAPSAVKFNTDHAIIGSAYQIGRASCRERVLPRV